MSGATGSSRAAPDPDFDGHLERPFDRLTVTERLWWLDETMRFAAACRPFVPGGQGVLRRVGWRVAADAGDRPKPAPSTGAWVLDGELRFTIDDHALHVARQRPGGAALAVAFGRSILSGGDLLPDVDVSAAHPWRALIGQFVVFRYATIDRTRLAIEGERDRAVIEAGA